VMAVSGQDPIALFLAAAQALLSHQPPDAVAPVALALAAQLHLYARSAVGLTALPMNARNLGFELLVLLLALAGLLLAPRPVVVPAGRDHKSLTQLLDGVFCFQGVDPLVALFGDSERMPKVFFKMSRCWRNRAFSRRSATSSVSIWLR